MTRTLDQTSNSSEDERPAKRQRPTFPPPIASLPSSLHRVTRTCSVSLTRNQSDRQRLDDSSEPNRFGRNKKFSSSGRPALHRTASTLTTQEPDELKEQHEHYDEGMLVFNETLRPGIFPDKHTRSATMLYNTGLLQAHQLNFKKSIQWFDLALVQTKRADQNRATTSLLFRVYYSLGYSHYRLRNDHDALECYTNALGISSQLGEPEEAASRNSIGVLSLRTKTEKYDEPLEMLQKSLAIYKNHLPQDSLVLAAVLNNVGRAHYLAGDYGSAISSYESSLNIRRAKLCDCSLDIAASICNVGQAHHQRGNFDTAMSFYQEFLQFATTYPFPDNRDVFIIIRCIADIHHKKRDLSKALTMYQEALEAAQLVTGTSFHGDISSTLNEIGSVYYELHDYTMAQKYYNESLKIEQILLGLCHPHVLITLLNIAQIHRQKGEFDVALLYFTEVHVRTVHVYGDNSLEAANTLSNMALMHFLLKDNESALELYQEVLRVQRDARESDKNTDVASTLNSIGLVLFSAGAQDLAKSCFYDSLKIRLTVLGPDHPDVAILWYNVATFHLETGDSDLAVNNYKETLRIEKLNMGDRSEDVILTLQHLGLVHQQRGELDNALAYFSEALEIERGHKGNEGRRAVTKLLNLIGNIHLQKGDISEMMVCYTEASRACEEPLIVAGHNFYCLSKLHPPCAATA